MEAEVWSAVFHEDKWLNTWRRERNKSMDPIPEPFEKQVESTPLLRNFGELHAHRLLKQSTWQKNQKTWTRIL